MPFPLSTPKKTTFRKKRSTRSNRYSKSKDTQLYRQKNPARFQAGWNAYKINQQVSRALNRVSELKLSPLIAYNNQASTPVALTNYAYTAFIGGNSVPSAYSGTWHTLSGFDWSVGDQITERTGKYMYLKKTTLMARIEMKNPAADIVEPPIRFRMVVFKHKRNADPTGLTKNPMTSLFIDTSGQDYGVLTAGKVSHDFSLGMLNKRHFVILRDTQFSLQHGDYANPLSGNPIISSGIYKNQRQFHLTFNHNKKTAFGTGAEPEDYDYRFGVLFIAMPSERNAGLSSADYDVSIRGATSALDN